MSKFLVDWETPPFLRQGKSCINFAIKLPTLTHISSSVYTTKHLRKIRRLGYKQFLYLLYVNSLKKFFVSKTKFNCFEKMAIFSYSLLPRIFKFRRSSLRLVFLITIVYNIVRIPPPPPKYKAGGGVNFDYLPRRRGESEKLEKGSVSMVQGQVLLKVCVWAERCGG